jgi:hypothetical protein
MSDDRHPLTQRHGTHALLHGAHESAVALSAALSAAIAAGMIEELPGGFYRDARLGG